MYSRWGWDTKKVGQRLQRGGQQWLICRPCYQVGMSVKGFGTCIWTIKLLQDRHRCYKSSALQRQGSTV